jgi:hypothetical protein
MADISMAMQAKSDQLNAVDIMGCEPVITIREVKVNLNAQAQKVWVYYHGDNNRPWKPSVGMTRFLAANWGTESDNWIGKSVKIFMEPTVIYAGKEVGGVHIRAMSDINERGFRGTLVINKQKRVPFHIEYLDMSRPQYPEGEFNSRFDKMEEAMQNKVMSLQQVIAQCQKTGDLTESQLQRLTEAAPIEIDEED